MKTRSPEEQLDLLRRGAVEIISEGDLLTKLRQGRPLRVKLGVDPSAPDIHLGITIVLRKLRQFQDLGHQAILVVGDFTAMIGDPSEKKKTRPMLTREEIQRNVSTYRDQYSKILDPQKTRVVFNSEWLGRMSFEDVIRLGAKTTVARVIERDDFANRLRSGVPIFMHELLYPLCQAMDSVQLQADVELGGTDQKFNNLMGRDLQREFGQEPQVVLLTPLLVGLDGVEKMSKSLGNAVGIADPPEEMYGKVMSLRSDSLIGGYFELCTNVPMEDVIAIRRSLKDGSLHPREAKSRLAREIVAMWHGFDAAIRAQGRFESKFLARKVGDTAFNDLVSGARLLEEPRAKQLAALLRGLREMREAQAKQLAALLSIGRMLREERARKLARLLRVVRRMRPAQVHQLTDQLKRYSETSARFGDDEIGIQLKSLVSEGEKTKRAQVNRASDYVGILRELRGTEIKQLANALVVVRNMREEQVRQLASVLEGLSRLRDSQVSGLQALLPRLSTMRQSEVEALSDKILKAGAREDGGETSDGSPLIPDAEIPLDKVSERTTRLDRLLVTLKLVTSNSEARRLVTQGAVSIDGQKMTDFTMNIELKEGLIIRVGKRRTVRLRIRRS